MKPYYQDANTTILNGDCIETMRTMPDSSIDSIVTDPPYGLGFMGKKWDALPPGEEWAQECLRVLKPGGHILAFGGSRTWHRLAVAIEDAGFEIRDGVLWLYGSGFPKSHDISKAIDKMAGADREVVGKYSRPDGTDRDYADWKINSGEWKEGSGFDPSAREITTPATPEAQQWDGWGTALKPAFEPIVMARKPLAEKTVARNVLAHGTGAINIDASRIGIEDAEREVIDSRSGSNTKAEGWGFQPTGETFKSHASGRWPANVLLDDHMAGVLDEQSGVLTSGALKPYVNKNRDSYSGGMPAFRDVNIPADSGGASRFFYCAKAGKSERPVVDGVAHATVKPLKLMRYLVRMVTPPGGTVLEPFAGSGTTIEAALLEGYNVIGIERETEYLPLIQHRIDRANGEKP